MDTKKDKIIKYYKAGIFIFLSVTLIAVILSVVTDSLFPSELRKYLGDSEKQEMGVFGTTWLGIVFLNFVYLVYVIVQMFKLKKNTRMYVVVLTLVSSTISLFQGPVIEQGFVSALQDLSCITWGLLLGMLFFSDLKENFQKEH